MATTLPDSRTAPHTPGPWFIDGGLIEAPNGERANGEPRRWLIGEICAGTGAASERLPSKSQQKANARLIASAPELLEALRDAAHDLEYIGNRPWRLRSEGDKLVALERAKKIRSAISKASGGAA